MGDYHGLLSRFCVKITISSHKKVILCYNNSMTIEQIQQACCSERKIGWSIHTAEMMNSSLRPLDLTARLMPKFTVHFSQIGNKPVA